MFSFIVLELRDAEWEVKDDGNDSKLAEMTLLYVSDESDDKDAMIGSIVAILTYAMVALKKNGVSFFNTSKCNYALESEKVEGGTLVYALRKPRTTLRFAVNEMIRRVIDIMEIDGPFDKTSDGFSMAYESHKDEIMEVLSSEKPVMCIDHYKSHPSFANSTNLFMHLRNNVDGMYGSCVYYQNVLVNADMDINFCEVIRLKRTSQQARLTDPVKVYYRSRYYSVIMYCHQDIEFYFAFCSDVTEEMVSTVNRIFSGSKMQFINDSTGFSRRSAKPDIVLYCPEIMGLFKGTDDETMLRIFEEMGVNRELVEVFAASFSQSYLGVNIDEFMLFSTRPCSGDHIVALRENAKMLEDYNLGVPIT